MRGAIETGRTAGGPLAPFTIEAQAPDFPGMATLYGWRHLQAATGRELDANLQSLGNRLKTNTLLELKLYPAVQPVTALLEPQNDATAIGGMPSWTNNN